MAQRYKEAGTKEMGIPLSKQMKPVGNQTLSKDTKNVTVTEAVAEKAVNLTHSEANDSTGNLTNIVNTSQGQGPTQLISHQMEPNKGNEAALKRMHQVPVSGAPQNTEQNIYKAANISQDADPVKYNPYLASAVSMTQQHTSPVKSKDKKSITPKPMLQQATSAKPITGPCHGVGVTLRKIEALRSDSLHQPQDVTETLSQQQLGPSAPVHHKTKPVHHHKKTTQPVQQQTNREVLCGHIQHEESRNITLSKQRPTAKETTDVPPQRVRTVAPCGMGMRATADSVHYSEASASIRATAQVQCKDSSCQVECRLGSMKQEEIIPQPSAFEVQTPLCRSYSEVVRGVTIQNLHSTEAEVDKKVKIKRSPSQKPKHAPSYVNETSTDLACHITDKTYNIAEQRGNIKASITDVLDAKPTEPPDPSLKVSKQSKAQVNNDVNASHVYYLKLAKMPEGDRKNFQQTAEETITTVQESSQQQGCNAMNENTNKKYELNQIRQLSESTNGNTSSCIQEVNMKARKPQDRVVEGMLTAAPNNAANNITAATDTGVKLRNLKKVKDSLCQGTAVKSRKIHSSTLKVAQQNKPNKNLKNVTRKEEMTVKGQAEREKSGISLAAPEGVHTEGRWHPFTVNQSCSHKVHCKHNPGPGLPPNIQKWLDTCPNYLCEPPWVNTERLADCLALREPQDQGRHSHQ